MGKWTLALLLWACAFATMAQDLAFPARSGRDGEDRRMSALAHEAIRAYREDDRTAYLGMLFRLQMVAGDHPAALASIHELRRRQAVAGGPAAAPPLYLQYEVLARAKAREAAGGLSFADSYRLAFDELFGALDDRGAQQARFSFGGNLARMQDDFAQALARQGDRRRLSLQDALDLLRKYQVSRAYAQFLPQAAARIAADEARRYVIERELRITTPAGVRLAALIVRPRRMEPLPTLLQFTIYAHEDWAMEDARRMAARGYAGVVAYTRGKGTSPEAIVAFEHDGEDAAAVIDWIAAQPWSDGRVGMYGGSYSGFTQWAAARQRPKALKAMATSATTAPGIDVPMEGGIFLNFMYPWPFYTTGNRWLDDATYGDQARWQALNRNWYASGRSYRSLPAIDGAANTLFLRWLQHPDYDAYWQAMIPQGQAFADIDIPVLATTGYFDGAQVGVLHYLREHLRHRPDADHTLLIGPFEHFSMQTGLGEDVQGYVPDRSARIDLQGLRLDWFDHVFKGAARPALLQDRINYQVMGADRWAHAPSLSAMAERRWRLYLQAGTGERHRLAAQAAGQGELRQRIDLRDRGDAGWTPPAKALIAELDPHGALVFASEPLGQATLLSGLFGGRLDFTVNKRDVDLGLVLYEQLAEGGYLQLGYWMQRASYAGDRRRRELLQPGRLQRIDFTSDRLLGRQLQAGSRLVMVLGVLRQGDLQINHGSGKDVSDETIDDAGEPLDIRWQGSSYLELPVGS